MESEEKEGGMAKFLLICRFLRLYWRAILVITLPFVCLPIFLLNNTPAHRCLYVVALMAGFWVTEALPLPVTSLIPMVAFPLMGILDSEKTSMCYLKETNMMFVGGLIVAIAVEHCNLHKRVALHVILVLGCSPRRLHIGLVTVTMFISMWISNTAATAMMCPIIEATLTELEVQGVGQVYEPEVEGEKKEMDAEGNVIRKPSKNTICYFIAVAYSASIGGIGTLVGSGTNLTFKGIYETTFPDSPGIDFTSWIGVNAPIMLLTTYGVWTLLQVQYMGLFRPNSKDAKNIRIGSQGELTARKLIRQTLDDMGPMSFHEGSVGVCFIFVVLLWFFRKPQFIPGWAEQITDLKVKDATAALIVVLVMFVVPAKPDFYKTFSSDPEKRPTVPSPGLITWKVVQQKMPWGLIFLLGGGFAVADGSKASGMSQMIAQNLSSLKNLPKYAVMVITCLAASFFTDFSSNVAIANIILPVLAEVSKVCRWHPMYLMMPAALACSHSYSLPVSTPPNAIAQAPCNIPTLEWMKAGVGASLISLIVLIAIFPFLGEAVYHMNGFPEWAEDNKTLYNTPFYNATNLTTTVVG